MKYLVTLCDLDKPYCRIMRGIEGKSLTVPHLKWGGGESKPAAPLLVPDNSNSWVSQGAYMDYLAKTLVAFLKLVWRATRLSLIHSPRASKLLNIFLAMLRAKDFMYVCK